MALLVSGVPSDPAKPTLLPREEQSVTPATRAGPPKRHAESLRARLPGPEREGKVVGSAWALAPLASQGPLALPRTSADGGPGPAPRWSACWSLLGFDLARVRLGWAFLLQRTRGSLAFCPLQHPWWERRCLVTWSSS